MSNPHLMQTTHNTSKKKKERKQLIINTIQNHISNRYFLVTRALYGKKSIRKPLGTNARAVTMKRQSREILTAKPLVSNGRTVAY